MVLFRFWTGRFLLHLFFAFLWWVIAWASDGSQRSHWLKKITHLEENFSRTVENPKFAEKRRNYVQDNLEFCKRPPFCAQFTANSRKRSIFFENFFRVKLKKWIRKWSGLRRSRVTGIVGKTKITQNTFTGKTERVDNDNVIRFLLRPRISDRNRMLTAFC